MEQASDVWANVREVDKLVMTVVVDNETDALSTPCASCTPSAAPDHQPVAACTSEVSRIAKRDGAFNVSAMCHAGHGLSLLLQAWCGGEPEPRTLLFDAGPDPALWRTNAERLGVQDDSIQAAVLSHWHADHSGGLPAVVGSQAGIVLDLHPDRPRQRGIASSGKHVLPIQEDPSWAELAQNGAAVQRHAAAHTQLGGCFYVSGAVPRTTDYERGMDSQVALQEDGSWSPDPDILEERYVAVRLAGAPGPLLFTGCSHAGVVNVMRDAAAAAGSSPYAVCGGLHLSTKAGEARIEQTVADMAAMGPQLVLAGHCTGWRAKATLSRVFEERFMPCSVGASYTFNAKFDH